MLAAAGCGAAPHRQAAPREPRLPPGLGRSWAQQTDAVSAALAAGDGCTAQARVAELRREIGAAVSSGRVPRGLLGPLTGSVRDLAGRITCTPPPAPAPPADAQPPDVPPGWAKHGRGDGHDHGKHRGFGDGG